MNVVFISPHFPLYYYNFCDRLKQLGVNVLGIGDASYDEISSETKLSLSEYYKVSNLENFDEVYKAVAYFISKYGKIDFVESQNEFWLETDAKIRTEFNISSGTKFEELAPMKYKSKMKDIYKKCGINVAGYVLIDDVDSAINFINQVGYPVVVKPDNGVGAISTYKLNNYEELVNFFSYKDNNITYIMEEFVEGHVETFDGITNASKDILICSSHVMLNSIMDNVNEAKDTAFYSQHVVNSDIKTMGTKVVKAFDTRSKFFHFEFFRLTKDKIGLGKAGELVGLEVNMRAPGAYIPDMINYSYDNDVYSIWANMIVYDKLIVPVKQKYVVGYAGRRDIHNYVHTHDEILISYKDNLVLDTSVPIILSAAMGNHIYLVRSEKQDELFEIIKYILEKT